MPTKKKPAKKVTTKRATGKKAATKKWAVSSEGKYQSFKLAKAPKFFTARITDQTVYWAILGILVLAIGIWIITINDKVQYLYDQIDLQNADSTITTSTKN